MNDPTQMMNRSFGIWQQQPPLPPQSADDPMIFQTQRPMFPPAAGSKPGRVHWKVKKAADKRKKAAAAAAAAGAGGPIVAPAGGSGYQPPTLNELQFQNRVKARRFYPKKKFTRFAPFAPRNTTSFIIRAKKSGGIASLVSPCPVTPAILPTPKFSPSREGLVDMAKEEWGVDGYGSMKGLIRLRSGSGAGGGGEGGEDDEDEDGSSESDVEEHLEVERRLDHDLSRFEMVYPSFGEDQGAAAAYLLENRVDDQDTHIAHLEEENLTLKERLFLMEREMGELRRRLQLLETEHRGRDGINHHNNNENNNIELERSYSNNNNMNVNEEASENDGGGDVCSEKSVGDGDADESNGTPTREEAMREGRGKLRGKLRGDGGNLFSRARKPSISFCQSCGSPTKQVVPDGEERTRAVCTICGKIHYENPKMVVGCLVEHNGKDFACWLYGDWGICSGRGNKGNLGGGMCGSRRTFTIRSDRHSSYWPSVYLVFRAKLKKPHYSPGPESLECQLFSPEDIPFDSLAFSSIIVTLRMFVEDIKAGNIKFHYCTLNKRPGASMTDPNGFDVDYLLPS